MRRRPSRSLAALTLLASAFLPVSVAAHGENSAREAEVTVEGRGVELAVLFALHDLEGAIELDADGDGRVSVAEADASHERLLELVREVFFLEADGIELKPSGGEVSLEGGFPLDAARVGGVVVTAIVRATAGADFDHLHLTVRFPGRSHDGTVHLRVRWGAGSREVDLAEGVRHDFGPIESVSGTSGSPSGLTPKVVSWALLAMLVLAVCGAGFLVRLLRGSHED